MKTSLLHKEKISGVPFFGLLPTRQSESGILVMSSDMRLRFMNGPAARLVNSARRDEAALTIPGLVASVIEDFCADVLKMAVLDSTGARSVSRELQRVAGDPERPILLRGFVLRSEEGIERSHVLVVLEETGGQC